MKNMKTKTPKTSGPGLVTWFLRAPLVFAAVCAVIFTVLALIGLAPQYITLVTPVVLVIAGYLAIRTARTKPIDRRSYVAADNGITILSLIVTGILALITPSIPYMMAYALNLGRGLYILSMLVIYLLSYYTVGLVVMNLYAVYLRCVKMGVAKWKIILTMPFTMLYCPAYFLSEKNTARPVIGMRSNLFMRLTDWVVARPINAVLCYVVLMLLSVWQVPSVDNIAFSVMLGLVFGGFMLISNPARRRENIAGPYATLSIFINIAFILYMLWLYIK